jgi:hypothetical protein
MLEILSAILGFSAPFLTEILKMFQRGQDNKHELALLEFQAKAKEAEHTYRMEELNIKADIEETKTLYQPAASFGVQLLDAAKNSKMNGIAFYPAFYLFVFLDFIASLVRPAITYSAFAFYVAVKWAQLTVARSIENDISNAVISIWTPQDMSIVILVLSYWFGQRAVKAAFGGSANTAYRGQ